MLFVCSVFDKTVLCHFQLKIQNFKRTLLTLRLIKSCFPTSNVSRAGIVLAVRTYSPTKSDDWAFDWNESTLRFREFGIRIPEPNVRRPNVLRQHQTGRLQCGHHSATIRPPFGHCSAITNGDSRRFLKVNGDSRLHSFGHARGWSWELGRSKRFRILPPCGCKIISSKLPLLSRERECYF